MATTMVAHEPELAGRLRPPRDVVEIVRALEQAGHETWCVGGAVRDALLGIPQLDWDVATAATPPQVRRLFKRTVPVGIEFGTMGVLDGGGRMHEVTTFRRDVRTDGRHAEVEFGASLDEDLARRDFTINAIAYHPLRGVLHDPFGGRDDLARGVVRAVGDADTRMREDRLRALRAIRFAARFGFALETRTWDAVCDSAPHMGRLSAERVKQELDKTMEQVEQAGGALRLWRDAGALAALVPALADVPAATLAALDRLPRAVDRRAAQRRVVRYATLFSHVRASELQAALRALRFSNVEAGAVQRIVAGWQGVGAALRTGLLDAGAPSDADVRRWVARTGRMEIAAVLRMGFALVADPELDDADASRARALFRRTLRIAFRDPVSVADLAIGGDDLRAAGIRPGPGMRRVLERLLDAVVEDPTRNTVGTLLAMAAAIDPQAPGDGRAHPERPA